MLYTGSFENELKLARKKHDLIGMRVYDQREVELPNIGMARVRDAETEKVMWLDTADKNVRKAYNDWHLEHSMNLKNTFLKSGADLINIRTDESYVKELMKFFKRRM